MHIGYSGWVIRGPHREDDEDIPITPPLSPTPFDEDVAAKKSNEIRIGPITRAHAKLLE
jgi:hypothetical protein